MYRKILSDDIDLTLLSAFLVFNCKIKVNEQKRTRFGQLFDCDHGLYKVS